MSRRKASDLKWIGGDSRCSVWFALGKLLMPTEYERVEAIRKNRRARARAQKARQEASATTAPGATTENVGADAQEAQDAEEGNKEEETPPPVDENEAATGGEAATEAPVEKEPVEGAAETSAAANENNGEETPQAAVNNATNVPASEAQPCSTGDRGEQARALGNETPPNGFSGAAAVAETPTPQPWSQGHHHSSEGSPPSSRPPSPVARARLLQSRRLHMPQPGNSTVEIHRQSPQLNSPGEQDYSIRPSPAHAHLSPPPSTEGSHLSNSQSTTTPPSHHHHHSPSIPQQPQPQYQPSYYNHNLPYYFNPTVPTHHYLSSSNHPDSSGTTYGYWTAPAAPNHHQSCPPQYQLLAQAEPAEFGYANYQYTAGTSFPASWGQDYHQPHQYPHLASAAAAMC